MYSKSGRDFSAQLLESAIFSVPITSFYNYIVKLLAGQSVAPINALYVLCLIALSIVVGYVAAKIRSWRPVKRLANRSNLPEADEDFLQRCFKLLETDEPVTVTLLNDDVFSGTPRSGSIFKNGFSRQYYFDNIAWYNKKLEQWDEHPGSLIMDISQIKYIETSKTLSQDTKA